MLAKRFKAHVGIVYGQSNKVIEAAVKAATFASLHEMAPADCAVIAAGGWPEWADKAILDRWCAAIFVASGGAAVFAVDGPPLPPLLVPAAPPLEPLPLPPPLEPPPPPVEPLPAAKAAAKAKPRVRSWASKAFDHFCYLEKVELTASAETLRAQRKHAGLNMAQLVKIAGGRRWKCISAGDKKLYAGVAEAECAKRVRDETTGQYKRQEMGIEEIVAEVEELVTPKEKEGCPWGCGRL